MQHEAVSVPAESTARVAVFVDGDNLPPTLAAPILAAAARLGRMDLRRVYAAEAGPKGWEAAAGFRVTRVAGGKNGTDLLLCIEAVEVACRGGFDRFVIASDDRDFSHLAHWLRERGMHVLGIGTTKSPEGWQAACSAFEFVEAPRPAAKAHAPLSELDRRLKSAIGGTPDGREMVRIGNVMSEAKVRLPEGCTWRSYMETRRDLYDLDPRGPKARVRWVGG